MDPYYLLALAAVLAGIGIGANSGRMRFEAGIYFINMAVIAAIASFVFAVKEALQ